MWVMVVAGAGQTAARAAARWAAVREVEEVAARWAPVREVGEVEKLAARCSTVSQQTGRTCRSMNCPIRSSSY